MQRPLRNHKVEVDMTVRFPNPDHEKLTGSIPGAMLVLFAALSTTFLFGEHRSYFYWSYDWISSMSMAIAANLSADHGFAGFIHRTLDGDGAVTYLPRHRFPIGAYATLKLAMLPFEGDLSAQIFAAKTLTVCFFCAAATTAWLALCRSLRDRWAAAAAVLLAFSSYHMLYHVDMVGEGVVDLFGVMLAFHGMTVFVQEGRFRQLAIKTCIALFLGWHTVALIAPFVVFGIAGTLFRSTRESDTVRVRIPSLREIVANDYVRYGFLSLAVFVFLLAANFSREYILLGGKVAVMELPSVQSMTRRVGAKGEYRSLRWEEEQSRWVMVADRIGDMAFPYASIDRPAGTPPGWEAHVPVDGLAWRVAGYLALGLCFAGLASVALWRRDLPALASLPLCGLLWAVIMPLNILHLFESIFLVGVHLTGWATAFLALRRLAGPRAVAVAASVAAATFGLSSFNMSRYADPVRHAETPRGFEATGALGHDAESVRLLRSLPGDFDVIREKMPEGSRVWIPTPDRNDLRVDTYGARYAVDFYLSGYVFAGKHAADFVLTNERVDDPALLTPENREVFLYDGALYDGWRRDKP